MRGEQPRSRQSALPLCGSRPATEAEDRRHSRLRQEGPSGPRFGRDPALRQPSARRSRARTLASTSPIRPRGSPAGAGSFSGPGRIVLSAGLCPRPDRADRPDRSPASARSDIGLSRHLLSPGLGLRPDGRCPPTLTEGKVRADGRLAGRTRRASRRGGRRKLGRSLALRESCNAIECLAVWKEGT